jgi:hypothetical protein
MAECGPLPVRLVQPIIGAPTLHRRTSHLGARSGPTYWGCSISGERRLPGAGRTKLTLDFWCRLPARKLDQFFRDLGKLERHEVRLAGAVDAFLTRVSTRRAAPDQLVIRGRYYLATVYLHALPVPPGGRRFIPVPRSWLLGVGRIVASKTRCPA